ncbi:MAG: DUF971 domain-containing protein [Pseudomonadales bacterium]
MATSPIPSKIKLHKKSRQLELNYENGDSYLLNCEYLRVFSPSAEVRGHGPGQEVLQWGKINVAISSLAAVGNYAIQPTFDDGHNSGIFSWDILYDLATKAESNWENYLARLAEAGLGRDPDVQFLNLS